MLQHHSLDLDVPRARLTLGTAQPTQHGPEAVQLRMLRPGLLLAPVMLDAHPLSELEDTDSSGSVINAHGL